MVWIYHFEFGLGGHAGFPWRIPRLNCQKEDFLLFCPDAENRVGAHFIMVSSLFLFGYTVRQIASTLHFFLKKKNKSKLIFFFSKFAKVFVDIGVQPVGNETFLPGKCFLCGYSLAAAGNTAHVFCSVADNFCGALVN